MDSQISQEKWSEKQRASSMIKIIIHVLVHANILPTQMYTDCIYL